MAHREPEVSCQLSNYVFYEFQGIKYDMPDSELTEGDLAVDAVLLLFASQVRGRFIAWIKLLSLWKRNVRGKKAEG